ncbi:MAG: succinate dehydrogenase [Deltaproteobacteria bacterium]|nr:succinate dehydrogenase [Deltaproteobacteria bacterium]
MAHSKDFKIGKIPVPMGQTVDIQLEVSERYTGEPVSLPIRVIRGEHPGPCVFVTAGIHGDELNGVGIAHELAFGKPLGLHKGTLIMVLVVNVFGFETQLRYMPDRRDLNRCFPGSTDGSLSSRVAHTIFKEVVAKSDYGIDLHSAAAPRINFPNIRGDLDLAPIRRMSEVFGCEVMVNSKGPMGSLRREATKHGCPTVILEAGEPFKIEPAVLKIGFRGVVNVLKELGMVPGRPQGPHHLVRVEKSMWVRAQTGGILRYHISPGRAVKANQPVATTVSVFGKEQSVLKSPVNGVVLGMTTLPTVKPGEPVCHIAIPEKPHKSAKRGKRDRLHHHARRDLATSISVSEREGSWANGAAGEDG